MKIFTTYLCLMVLLCLPQLLPAQEGSGVDNRIYADLLLKHVHDGRVNYDGFKKDEYLLDQYLDLLSQVDTKSLPEDHKFAFYINVYNAFTIKLILLNFPGINSIKEIGSFFSGPWSKKFIPFKTGTVSLDHVEHKILRPEFKDPRVHFAINCASKSCPPLRAEPYDGQKLNAQLDSQAADFINAPPNTYILDGRLHISKIFKWFKEDFSGKPLRFINQYARGDLKKEIQAHGPALELSYLEYDWTLNR